MKASDLGSHALRYRLLVAVDIQGYSARTPRAQLDAQRALHTALGTAADRAGLDRSTWERQVGGDGELAVLPEDTDPVTVVGAFVHALGEALTPGTRGGPDASGPRVRMALHHGTLAAGPFGPAGDAPIVVQRLLDSGPLRRALADHPGRGLAVAVSDALFQDVVATGFCPLPPAWFTAVRVRAKGAVFNGHVLNEDPSTLVEPA